MIDLRTKRIRRIGAAVAILALLPALWFGVRTYRSFLLVQSAYALGAPEISNVRPWMTLDFVAKTFHVPAHALVARLGLPPSVPLDTTLKTIAERQRTTPLLYAQQVQQAIVAAGAPRAAPRPNGTITSVGGTGDDLLSALLVYGYPALGAALLLGAVGVPLPTGLATMLAGSLAAKGSMNWLIAGAIAVAASIVGDIIGFGIGRGLGRGFIERRGRWLGVTPARWARVQELFRRWGGITVLLTRTLVSHLSSVVSLLAGIGGYRLANFLLFASLGRVLWTSAYLGLGYAVGSDLESATEFLKNVTGLVVSLAVLAAASATATGMTPAAAPRPKA